MGKEATSLVVQWLRIHLPMQVLWVRPLVRELKKSHIPWGKLSHTLQLEKALHAAMKTQRSQHLQKKKKEEGKLRVGAMERKISRKTGGKERVVPSVTAPNRGVPHPCPHLLWMLPCSSPMVTVTARTLLRSKFMSCWW